MPKNYIKRIFTAFAILLAVLLLLFLYLIYKPSNLPTANLTSPSQETRDATAKILRATAKPPSKLKWLFFTLHIRKGESEEDILKLLKSYNIKPWPGLIVGSLAEFDEYSLDDYWILNCEYNSDDKSLIEWKLSSGWRGYDVQWPTNFTGVWITYYANGQKFIEGSFTNGIRSGESICFRPNGSTNFVFHFDHDKENGLWSQYYPSGRLQFQCQYSNSVRVGIWVRYNEDGTTNSVKDLSKP
jgi:hypothetical protein